MSGSIMFSFIFGFIFGNMIGITVVVYLNLRRYERENKND